MDRVGVLCVSVQDVGGIKELGEVASRVRAIERTVVRLSSRVLDGVSKRKRNTDGRPVAVMSVAVVATREGCEIRLGWRIEKKRIDH